MRRLVHGLQNGVLVIGSAIVNCLLLGYIFIDHQTTKEEFRIRALQEVNSRLCAKFDQIHRLKPNDLSRKLSFLDEYKDIANEWNACESVKASKKIAVNTTKGPSIPAYRRLKYCEFEPLIEQKYQRMFFDEVLEPRLQGIKSCVLLPPQGYKWPSKHVDFPTKSNESAVFWPNIGVQSYKDLTIFNPRYTKNVHHFYASEYDISHEKRVDIAARFIPFSQKIRSMLDIGSGAGALSFILSKRYDVTVLNTALPDFPYCEYISERGGLCTFLDANRVMPFAKFSFDVIHHSWVFHSSTPDHWIDVLLEQNRILRPGGYLWIKDGLSKVILRTIKFLLIEQLGYKSLYEKAQKIQSRVNVTFGFNRFEVDWEAILVKPLLVENSIGKCGF